MLKAAVVDWHDSRVVKFFYVVELSPETTTRMTQCGGQAFHIQQGETTTLNDLLGFAKTQQAFHDLALIKLATQVLVKHGGESSGATRIIVGLTGKVLVFEVGDGLNGDATLIHCTHVADGVLIVDVTLGELLHYHGLVCGHKNQPYTQNNCQHWRRPNPFIVMSSRSDGNTRLGNANRPSGQCL